MPAARTASAVVSAMWTSGTSIAALIESATLCIVFVHSTSSSAPAVASVRASAASSVPASSQRPVRCSSSIAREVDRAEQAVGGVQSAEPVAHLLVDEPVVLDRRLPAHPAEQPDPLHVRPSTGLDVAAKVPVIAGHLASHGELRDRLQHPHQTAQLTFGHEVHPRPVPVGLERPRSVDRVGPLDDVRVDAHGPVELGELDDLLELLAARRLRALSDTRAEPRSSVCQLLHGRLRCLPLREVRRVREVVEDDFRLLVHEEGLFDSHAVPFARGCLLLRPSRARSKKAITRRSYSAGRASMPPVCCEPGTSQIDFGSAGRVVVLRLPDVLAAETVLGIDQEAPSEARFARCDSRSAAAAHGSRTP